MKKNLLKKMAKAASVALVAGVMVCGAGLATSNTASANGVPGLTTHEVTLLSKKGVKAENYVANVYNKTNSAKATKKAYEKVMGKKGLKHAKKFSKKSFAKKAATKRAALAKRAAKKAAAKRAALTKKAAKRAAAKKAKLAKRVAAEKAATKKAKAAEKAAVKKAKVAKKAAAKKAAAKRAALAKKAAKKAAARKAKLAKKFAAEKAAAKKAAAKAVAAKKAALAKESVAKRAAYEKTWNHAEKVNKKAEAFDVKQANKDLKKGYKKAAKNAMYHANKKSQMAKHDAFELSLAK